jgi:hypothetical protein
VLADVSVPLLGTNFVETPQISGVRSIVHFILFFARFYFGFVKKPKAWNRSYARPFGPELPALWRPVTRSERGGARALDVQVIETFAVWNE